LRSLVAALAERYAPHTIPRRFDQASLRQQAERIQHHVKLFFNTPQISSVKNTTVGKCGSQVDWRMSVRQTAKQTTIDVLVQPEQEPAQPLKESEWAPRIFRGRSQDRDARCGPGSLNAVYALEQPDGNRAAIRNEQETERWA